MQPTRTLHLIVILIVCATLTLIAGEKLPHHQTTPPGPALTPDEGIAKMVLPAGFKIECVASEPDVVNPTAFTFDERGRIWVCESVEYPRADAGPGKDRIKILEFNEKDGKYHHTQTIKEGLNIPCGIVMGNGGFYYTNSPDIVFAHLDANGKIDKEEVILTGFGRSDRHELPNSLTWGPDGWLYGMNGVFNPSKVVNQGKTFDITCAVWRWHPKTKKLELFAEGTSNPWGLDYNAQGDWFVSCCVIKHLFHITQSGYYHRQGGPYPPFTHKIADTLVTTQEHYMAANAGLCIYQGDAFPKEFQNAFFMGNLHGSQINHDIVTRNGSTYIQKNGPDFIDAHDKWFVPVSQKVGPDGCLYVLDWYDKYHCYQDSGRPDLDRERGRIYRISYNGTPRTKPFDLQKLSNDELITIMVTHSNQWQRREAQRLLNERFEPAIISRIQSIAISDPPERGRAETPKSRQHDQQIEASHRHALWLLCSQDSMEESFHLQLLNNADPVRRNWGVRMIGQMGTVSQPVYDKLLALVKDPNVDVRLQVPVAAGRLTGNDPFPILFAMMENAENAKDPIIPNIIYNNFKPFSKTRGDELMRLLSEKSAAIEPFNATVVAWLKECIAGGGNVDPSVFISALKNALGKTGGEATNEKMALTTCIDAFNAASVKADVRAKAFDAKLRATIEQLAAKDGKQRVAAATVALWWKNSKASEFARATIANANADASDRAALIKALGETKDAAHFDAFAAIFNDATASAAIRKNAIDALGALNAEKAAPVLLRDFKTLPPELKAPCVNTLVNDPMAAIALLDALEAKKIGASDINSNNASSIVQLNVPALTERVTKLWGKVKTSSERDPERVKIVNEMRKVVLAHKPGDAAKGWKVFEKNCQQCHAIYGKGNDVGPNLTGAGRENLDAILNSVLDPNLVIGDVYFQHRVKTNEGLRFEGLLAEETEKTISFKVAGGEIKKFVKADIAKHDVTKLSLMPEGLEKAMTVDEFCDLVAFMLSKEEPKK
ncbi:MAG: PVC-type heme-binding CxxCH protein [Planctomycetota bacterium]